MSFSCAPNLNTSPYAPKNASEDSLITIEQEFGERFLRLHRNCLVAQASILGYEKRHETDGESHWVALLKDIPDTVAVSRRQHHVLRELAGKLVGS